MLSDFPAPSLHIGLSLAVNWLDPSDVVLLLTGTHQQLPSEDTVMICFRDFRSRASTPCLPRKSACFLVWISCCLVVAPSSFGQSRQNDDDRATLSALLDAMPASVDKDRALTALEQSKTWFERAAAVKSLVFLDVSINPESRVKLAARKQRIRVPDGKPAYLLMQVENLAGITAPLKIEALNLVSTPVSKADWCQVKVVDHPQAQVEFSGSENEFRLLEIIVNKPGLWELRFVGEAGQGTQDLGFRATADVLVETQSNGAR